RGGGGWGGGWEGRGGGTRGARGVATKRRSQVRLSKSTALGANPAILASPPQAGVPLAWWSTAAVTSAAHRADGVNATGAGPAVTNRLPVAVPSATGIVAH